MSWEWTNYILKERRDLKGIDLLCALIVANYASADDRCYPGLQRLASDMRTSVRSVQRHLRSLEEKNVFRITNGNGRGAKTSFELIKGDRSVVLSDFATGISTTSERATELSPLPEEKGDETVTLSEEKRRQNAHEKGDTSDTKGRQNAHSHNMNLSFKPEENKREETSSRSRHTQPPKDERSNHPAIVAIREATNRFPNRLLWDEIILRLGDTPDIERLKASCLAWIGCGNNPVGFKGMIDWYETGQRDNRGILPSGLLTNPDADCSHCGNERRIRGTLETWPCEKCRPAEYKAWQRQRGKL